MEPYNSRRMHIHYYKAITFSLFLAKGVAGCLSLSLTGVAVLYSGFLRLFRRGRRPENDWCLASESSAVSTQQSKLDVLAGHRSGQVIAYVYVTAPAGGAPSPMPLLPVAKMVLPPQVSYS